MSQELLYTSAPHGLKPGSRGFCTVLSTQGMPAPLATALESLSGYRPVFAPSDERAHLNPIAWSHLSLSVVGKSWHVLSRVADYGLDYSQRTNKLAHHVALTPAERAECGPAQLLSTSGLMRSEWDGEPSLVGPRPVKRLPATAPSVCRAWKELTGDAGWGGVLAESFLREPTRPVFLIFEPGQDPLPLLAESIALLPIEKRWEVTFSTYFTGLPQGVTCHWRCLLSGSPEAQQSLRYPKALRIDLTEEVFQPALGGDLVETARDGIDRSPGLTDSEDASDTRGGLDNGLPGEPTDGMQSGAQGAGGNVYQAYGTQARPPALPRRGRTMDEIDEKLKRARKKRRRILIMTIAGLLVIGSISVISVIVWTIVTRPALTPAIEQLVRQDAPKKTQPPKPTQPNPTPPAAPATLPIPTNTAITISDVSSIPPAEIQPIQTTHPEAALVNSGNSPPSEPTSTNDSIEVKNTPEFDSIADASTAPPPNPRDLLHRAPKTTSDLTGSHRATFTTNNTTKDMIVATIRLSTNPLANAILFAPTSSHLATTHKFPSNSMSTVLNITEMPDVPLALISSKSVLLSQIDDSEDYNIVLKIQSPSKIDRLRWCELLIPTSPPTNIIFHPFPITPEQDETRLLLSKGSSPVYEREWSLNIPIDFAHLPSIHANDIVLSLGDKRFSFTTTSKDREPAGPNQVNLVSDDLRAHINKELDKLDLKPKFVDQIQLEILSDLPAMSTSSTPPTIRAKLVNWHRLNDELDNLASKAITELRNKTNILSIQYLRSLNKNPKEAKNNLQSIRELITELQESISKQRKSASVIPAADLTQMASEATSLMSRHDELVRIVTSISAVTALPDEIEIVDGNISYTLTALTEPPAQMPRTKNVSILQFGSPHTPGTQTSEESQQSN